MRKSQYPKETGSYGGKIKKARLDQSLSLKYVSAAANISEGYLSRIESNQQIPSISIATQICDVLKLENMEKWLTMMLIETNLGMKKGTQNLNQIWPYNVYVEAEHYCKVALKIAKELPLSPEIQKLINILEKQQALLSKNILKHKNITV